MSNIVSKIRQRIALKDNNKFDLSCDHITTSDFFQISPVYFKEMVPGEKIRVNQETFTRLAPLTNPMYGRCRITNRAFFVPMRTIMKHWNEFITDVPVNSSFIQVPRIDPTIIAETLTTSIFSQEVNTSTAVPVPAHDFSVPVGPNSTGTIVKYYNFTDKGRRAWKLLCSLGYRIPLGYYRANRADSKDYMSALPLLGFVKIFKDWYQNQAYATNLYDNLFELSTGDIQDPQISGTQLQDILNYCGTALYDKDYFTSAWDRPVAPNNSLMSPNRIVDASNTSTLHASTVRRTDVLNNTTDSATTSTTPVLRGALADGSTSANSGNITQYALDALKSLTDYVKRHQIAGGLAMDRMLVRFGVKPSDAALDRSVYIGKQDVDVQISDVMATAAGENTSVTTAQNRQTTVLGEYAGKGIGYSDNGWFEYDTKEFGYFMIISVLQPTVGYVQGMSRYNLHKDRLDFFTPEFDSLGVQAIARKELMADYMTSSDNTNLASLGHDAALDGVFGYTSRYAEYKSQMDNLTGDFTLASRNTGLDSWHLNRIFDGDDVTITDISHNFGFTQGSQFQYDRVFAYKNGEGYSNYDHFTIIHHFNIEDYAPMAQLFDDYKFDGGSKEVSIEVNGTQLN